MLVQCVASGCTISFSNILKLQSGGAVCFHILTSTIYTPAGRARHQDRNLFPVPGPRACAPALGAVLLSHRGCLPAAAAYVPLPGQLLYHRLVSAKC